MENCSLHINTNIILFVGSLPGPRIVTGNIGGSGQVLAREDNLKPGVVPRYLPLIESVSPVAGARSHSAGGASLLCPR